MPTMLRTLEEKVDPRHAALLVIDMQNDLCSLQGSFAKIGMDVSMMAAVVDPVDRLARRAREANVLTIYTQVIDTYSPAVSPAYYEANLSYFEDFKGEEADDQENAPWITPDFGQAFCPPIEPRDEDVVIIKHRYGAFVNTKLDQILRSNGIQSLILAGVMTDVCVDSTAREALDRDYYVVIPEDCTATNDANHKKASLEILGTFFGTVTNSKDIISAWQRFSAKG